MRGGRSAWLGSERSGPQRAALELTATPTGEDRRKVYEEVGVRGERCGRGHTCSVRPSGLGLPREESGRAALGEPRSRAARLPTPFGRRGLPRSGRSCGLRAPRLCRGCPVPTGGILPSRTPRQHSSPRGPRRRDGAHGVRRWSRVAGRRAQRSRGRRLAPSPARSLAPPRSRYRRSLARSPPPLAPRAHNEAAGREVVPAAASAPLPQSMPPPAEHLALGWEGGPGGRGLGPGLDLQGVGSGPGWGAHTPPQGAPLASLSSQTWPQWVDLSVPQEKPRGQPHPQAHRLHTLVGSDYCGLPRGPRGRLSVRPGGAQLFLPFLFLPRNSLPPPSAGGPPPFMRPWGPKRMGGRTGAR